MTLSFSYVLNRLNLNDDFKLVRPGLEINLVWKPIFSKKTFPLKRQDLPSKFGNEGAWAMKGEKEQVSS